MNDSVDTSLDAAIEEYARRPISETQQLRRQRLDELAREVEGMDGPDRLLHVMHKYGLC
jgi:hypothetical protein